MSGMATPRYRRVVLELGQGEVDAVSLRAAAEFARLLDASLHALFVEDEALLSLADLPFARELRLPSRQWRSVDAAALAADLHRAAAAAERLVEECARAAGVPRLFEVARGDPAECLGALCALGDIIAIAEPRDHAARAARSFRRVRDAAAGSAASVLLLPAAAPPRPGPVVAVLAGADDPALEPAAAIAARARDTLVLVGPAAAETAIRHRLASLPHPAVVRWHGLAAVGRDALAAVLAGTAERLLLVTRGTASAPDLAAATALAGERGAPVVLVEPAA